MSDEQWMREALALAREEGVSVLENVQTTAIGKNCVEFSVNGAKMTMSKYPLGAW